MKYEVSEDILAGAGFHVEEDSYQPGMFVWTRRHNGKFIEECDVSFDSAEQAWGAARETFAKILREDLHISEDQWWAMSAEERMTLALSI